MLLDLAQQLEIEKQTVSTLLDSALRSRSAEKRLARVVGLTPVHLSYLRRGKRLPSIATAKQIAAALPWTPEQREGFVYHVARIWQFKNARRRAVERRAPGRPAAEVVEWTRQAHAAAVFARDSAQARLLYRRACNMAELLLDVTDPAQAPLEFLELSFVAHDALCVLDRNDEALWHARRARAVAANLERRDFRDKERIDFVLVNARRCEAVALHNLGLARPMQQVCDEVETLDALRRSERFWRPWLNRDKIQALTDTPRFSIRAAEHYAREAYRLCEQRAEAYDPLLTLLISEALVGAYIKYRNFAKAYRVLSDEMARLDRIPHIGPLHKVLFFRTFAQWYWEQGSRGDEWRYFARTALELARQAGLAHQLHQMQREFGDLLV